MSDWIKLIFLSIVMLIPFIIFNVIFENLNSLFILIIKQMLLVLPVILLSKSGYKWGFVSALILSPIILIYSQMKQPFFDFYNFSSTLLWIPVDIFSTSIASKGLENKGTFIFYLMLSIGIQLLAFVTGV